jgi:hypothetical protein
LHKYNLQENEGIRDNVLKSQDDVQEITAHVLPLALPILTARTQGPPPTPLSILRQTLERSKGVVAQTLTKNQPTSSPARDSQGQSNDLGTLSTQLAMEFPMEEYGEGTLRGLKRRYVVGEEGGSKGSRETGQEGFDGGKRVLRERK